MTLREVITAWLVEHGREGLCNSELECGCWVGDLMPCDEPGFNDCVVAAKMDAASYRRAHPEADLPADYSDFVMVPLGDGG